VGDLCHHFEPAEANLVVQDVHAQYDHHALFELEHSQARACLGIVAWHINTRQATGSWSRCDRPR
jgi:hypothetical protein